jgi:hypothetical protein
MKAQYDTYTYNSELCRLKNQSIVECRVPGTEIVRVLYMQAKAVAISCECLDGEVKYSGKLLLSIVYEDLEKKVCRIERGAEFYHKAEDGVITPACFAKVVFNTENITTRREGTGLYVSVVVGAEIDVFGTRMREIFIGGENVVVKKKAASMVKIFCVSGEIETEDEFTTDYVGDVLLHNERTTISSVVAKAGQIDVTGEVCLNLCVLKRDETLCAYERFIPFALQIPCEEAFGNVGVNARCTVSDIRINATCDEERGVSLINVAISVIADCIVYVKEEILVAEDAFSLTNELTLEREKVGGRYLTNCKRIVEQVGGEAALSNGATDGVLIAAFAPQVEISCRKTESGGELEGALQAELLIKGDDGAYKKNSLSLPFLLPIGDMGDEAEADGIVSGLSVRKKSDGGIVAEATLKIFVKAYKKLQEEYVCRAETGEEYPKEKAAFQIFVPREGDDLWQVAKRLKKRTEDVEKCNPTLHFPIKKGEKLFIYTQCE